MIHLSPGYSVRSPDSFVVPVPFFIWLVTLRVGTNFDYFNISPLLSSINRVGEGVRLCSIGYIDRSLTIGVDHHRRGDAFSDLISDQ